MAFEHVVALTPEQLPAREALALLYGESPDHEQAAIENHRQLLNADIARSSSLRSLGAIYLRRGQLDRTRCCYELLALLGTATPAERAFLDENRPPELKPDDHYAGVIDDRDRALHLAIGEAVVMSEIFSCLWAGAPGLIGQRLEEFGVSARDKVSPMADLDLGRIYGQVGKALGNKKTAPLRPSRRRHGRGHDRRPGAARPGGGPGHGRRRHGSRGPVPDRARAGDDPARVHPGSRRPPQAVHGPVASVLRAFHPRHAKRRTAAGDAAAEQAAKLKKNVPYKVSKQLVELFQKLGNTSWSSLRWRTVVHQIGNRTGLVMCGDLSISAQIVMHDEGSVPAGETASPEAIRKLATSNEPLRELLRFANQRGLLHAAREAWDRDREGRSGLRNGLGPQEDLSRSSQAVRSPGQGLVNESGARVRGWAKPSVVACSAMRGGGAVGNGEP